MSKDRYRPSQADFEIVETSGHHAVVESTPEIDAYYDDEGFGDEEATSETPGGLRVSRQVVRYTSQGVMVVDVTLAWGPVAGADEYRVRVTAA